MGGEAVEQQLLDSGALKNRKPRSFRPSEIIKHVYIGGQVDARDLHHLFDNQIQVVLCAAKEHSREVQLAQQTHPPASSSSATTVAHQNNQQEGGGVEPSAPSTRVEKGMLKTSGVRQEPMVALMHVPKTKKAPKPKLEAIPGVSTIEDVLDFIPTFRAQHPPTTTTTTKGTTTTTTTTTASSSSRTKQHPESKTDVDHPHSASGSSSPPPAAAKTLLWVSLPLTDNDKEDIVQYFDVVDRLITCCRTLEVGIFVHCLAGRSRSVALVCAHLVRQVQAIRSTMPKVSFPSPSSEASSTPHHLPIVSRSQSICSGAANNIGSDTPPLELRGLCGVRCTEVMKTAPPRLRREAALTTEVLDFMRTRRLCVEPNEGFYQQLLQWERQYNRSSSIHTRSPQQQHLAAGECLRDNGKLKLEVLGEEGRNCLGEPFSPVMEIVVPPSGDGSQQAEGGECGGDSEAPI